MTCKLCGWQPALGEEFELDLDEAILGDLMGPYPVLTHDCVGRRIDMALSKERSRIACVIRRVAERWRERGALDIGRLLGDVANAIEQETKSQ